jgi:hypothetical protein
MSDPQTKARELRKAQAEHVLRFSDLEEAYASAQAKVQSGKASAEEITAYNDLADQVVAERQAGRAVRDQLKQLEGVPEGDGVAEPEAVVAPANFPMNQGGQ